MMAAWRQMGWLCALALVVTTTLSFSSQPDLQADASAGVRWSIHSERDVQPTNAQDGSGQNITITTEYHSDDGQGFTYDRIIEVNPDGSSHEHEEITWPNGACSQKKWTRDTDTDVQRNRTVHVEETGQKGKKCYLNTTDYKLDRNNKQLYFKNKVTEIPCACNNPQTPKSTPTEITPTAPARQYVLEVHWEGSIPFNNGGGVEWGPETNTIPLTLKPNSSNEYEGHFKGVWHAKLDTDNCHITATYPVTIEVSAVENGELDFSVSRSMGITIVEHSCGSSSATLTIPSGTEAYSLTLPMKDGASKSYQYGKVTETYTLKVGN